MLEAPSQTLNALPSTPLRAPENTSANALLQGLGKAGDVVTQMALRAQAEENETRTLQVENTLRDQYTAFEVESQQRTGHKTRGLTQDVSKWWDDQGKAALEGLDNDVQREALKRRMGALRNASIGRAASYELTQTRQARQVDRDANDAKAYTAAVRAAGNTATTDAAVLTIHQNADAWAVDNGYDQEAANQRAAKAVSQMHAEVLGTLANNKPVADAYFAKYGNDLAGEDIERVRTARERGGRLFQVQQTVDQLKGMALSEEAGMAWIQRNLGKKPEDADLRKDVEVLWRAHADNEHQLRSRASEEAAAEIEAIVAADPAAGYLHVPQSLVSKLTPAGQRAWATRVQGFRSGKSVVTDYAVFGELERMARTRPADFQKVDLSAYSSSINVNDLKVLENYRRNGVKPQGTDELRLNAVYSELDINGLTDQDKAARAKISGRYKSLLNEVEMGQDHRPATDDQRDAILRRAVAAYNHELKDTNWYGGTAPLTPEQAMADVMDDLTSRGLSPNAYPALVHYAAKTGKPRTADNLASIDASVRGRVAAFAPRLGLDIGTAMDAAYMLMQTDRWVTEENMRTLLEAYQQRNQQ
ncbi:hypothetical protein UFOVP821_43 [uncultured Caudovirales phage]|uniref:Uncharacterized protein n=1 Tax=uncultured Caudovirales phage TaxID=2100421 RepID=A0A6J5P8F5_9CAUD|nr:hypothetical protein UFOVP821_43 [uncultured Caudovirales phage]